MKATVKTPRAASERPVIHTGLTLDDVDTINGCRQRLLNAAVLLELGLHYMDDNDVGDPECIQNALLDVVARLREDATQIAVRMDLAGEDGARRSQSK